MNRFRRWLTARLGRRLAFSQFLVTVLTMLVMQLIRRRKRRSQCTAQRLLRGMSVGQHALKPRRFQRWWILGRRLISLQYWICTGTSPLIYLIWMKKGLVCAGTISRRGGDEIERLIAVTIVNVSGEILAQDVSSLALKVYQADWDELVATALSGVQNPYELSRLLTLHDSGLVLGSAAIPGVDGKSAGVVLVEMYSSIRIETSPSVMDSLIGLVAIMFFTSVFGTPVLLLALLLSSFSGVMISRSLSRRLKRLEETANTMAEGDLTLTVLDTSEDEIGQLGQAFNQLADQLGETLEAVKTEKEQVENLLKTAGNWLLISHMIYEYQLGQCVPIWRH